MKTAKKHTLSEIMDLVNKAYDRAGPFPFDYATGQVREGCGDPLLELIVREIVETYEPNRQDPLGYARGRIDAAGNQLQAVSTALWYEQEREG